MTYPCHWFNEQVGLAGDLGSTNDILIPLVEMDDSNITMEEYIKLEAKKARRHGQTFNWETVTYGKIRYRKDINYFKDFETNFPAIVFDDPLGTDHKISSEPTVSPLDDNDFDFKISFDESDDEDYTIIYDKNLFSYKLISVNDLETDSKNDNDEVSISSYDVVIEQSDGGVDINAQSHNPPPTKLSPLVSDDVGEEEAIENNTKVVNNNNVEDKSIEVDEVVNIKESKSHPLEQVIGNL
ncbi:hypothetical protein Tco_1405202 [Tanacetum coccineum]